MKRDQISVENFRKAELQYERRIVVFYDVLGWKDKIERAGANPAALARLHNVVAFYSLIAGKENKNSDVRAQSFSDNVVISAPIESKEYLLIMVSIVQIIAATSGCLLRGGITIGDIFHDSFSVFGPALNRAYEIESQLAVFPRIIVDPDYAAEFFGETDLLTQDNHLLRVDPFRRKQFEKLCRLMTSWRFEQREFSAEKQSDEFIEEVMTNFTQIFQAFKSELERPLTEKQRDKVAWFFNRLAFGFGIPERADDFHGS